MTRDEITNYVQNSSRGVICIHRERCVGADLIVKSIYITGKPSAFVLSVEFDPITLIEEGDGWIWHSAPLSLDSLISKLEACFGQEIDKCKNITKTGGPLHDHFDLELSNYDEVSELFKVKFNLGKSLLPKGFVWTYKN